MTARRLQPCSMASKDGQKGWPCHFTWDRGATTLAAPDDKEPSETKMTGPSVHTAPHRKAYVKGIEPVAAKVPVHSACTRIKSVCSRFQKKERNSVFFHQRHALSTSFDIFVVTYRVTNFLPKPVDTLFFPATLNFYFLKSLFSIKARIGKLKDVPRGVKWNGPRKKKSVLTGGRDVLADPSMWFANLKKKKYNWSEKNLSQCDNFCLEQESRASWSFSLVENNCMELRRKSRMPFCFIVRNSTSRLSRDPPPRHKLNCDMSFKSDVYFLEDLNQWHRSVSHFLPKNGKSFRGIRNVNKKLLSH